MSYYVCPLTLIHHIMGCTL